MTEGSQEAFINWLHSRKALNEYMAKDYGRKVNSLMLDALSRLGTRSGVGKVDNKAGARDFVSRFGRGVKAEGQHESRSWRFFEEFLNEESVKKVVRAPAPPASQPQAPPPPEVEKPMIDKAFSNQFWEWLVEKVTPHTAQRYYVYMNRAIASSTKGTCCTARWTGDAS